MPKTRFKYKSLIKTGNLKVVSLVAQSSLNHLSQFETSKKTMAYRILTYTSKNEFFVIDVFKRPKKGGAGALGSNIGSGKEGNVSSQSSRVLT
jgi:hypothetical protein